MASCVTELFVADSDCTAIGLIIRATCSKVAATARFTGFGIVVSKQQVTLDDAFEFTCESALEMAIEKRSIDKEEFEVVGWFTSMESMIPSFAEGLPTS